MKKLTLFLAALLFSVSAFADFTAQQLTALKAAALADQTAAQYVTNPSPANDQLLADWFNQASTFIVWKSSLDPDSMRQGMVDGASQLDNLTVGKRDTLFYLFAGTLPNAAALRSTIDSLCGTQTTLKAGLDAQFYRPATIAEKALASGAGTAASPGTMSFEGFISQSDASLIRS